MSEYPERSTPNTPDPQEAARRRNAIRIALVTGIVMTAITALTLPVVFQIGMERIYGPIITATAALVAFVSAFISSRNRPTLGSGLLISVILALSFVVTFLFENNQGVAIAAIIVFLVSTVASFTMPQVWVNRLIVISVILGALNILADFYLPNLGLPSDPRYTNTIAAVVSAVYIIILLRRFGQYSLRTKLALSFVLIVLAPVIMLGVQNTFLTSRDLREQAQQDLVETAKAAAQTIDSTLGNELTAIRTEAQIIDFADYLNLPPDRRAGSLQEKRANEILLALKSKNPAFISSYAVLDLNGVDVLDTYQPDVGIEKSDRDYFQEPLASGQAYVSPVRASQTVSDFSIYFSAPIRDSEGTIVGILRSRYDAGFLQEIIVENAANVHAEEFAVVVDNDAFLRIAHSENPELLYRTYQPLTVELSRILQDRLQLPVTALQGIAVPQAEVVQGLQNIDEQAIFEAPALEYEGAPAFMGGYRVRNANWTVLVSRTERSILAPIEIQTRAITVTSMAILLLAGLAGVAVAQILARPITQLAGTAAEIASGNLNARAVATTQDEIGALANSFNRMTGQLRDTLGGLERRVAERTADLDSARLLSERRAQELQAISEISRAISTEQRLEVLLPLITRLVSDRFEFYHVGIFFVDEARRFAHLQAANSEGGQRMLARGHRLEMGVGVVGTVAQTARPRIALDVGSDAAYFDNPDLPNTRSEMALPLNVRGQTIGVLDVQSTKPGAFTEADVNNLGILADQIAIALENARLFGQMQEAREEAEALYAQIQRREWSAFAGQESRLGYRQTATGGRRLVKPIETEEIRDAIVNGHTIVLDGQDPHSQPTIAMPVKLRGQTIGVLNIKAPARGRKWNEDEINLVQAVSDRLALALDNARLLHESQRRAAKEAKIGEVSAKIGASINMRNVLQTAVEELGRALPGSEVIIQFESDDQSGSRHPKGTDNHE